MVGPFKTARGGMTHLLVAVDKFTKWIEAKPIKKLNGPTAMTFISDITIRYGIPHSIITNNGTNFAKGALARFCATGRQMEAFRSPSSPNEGPLKMSSAEKG